MSGNEKMQYQIDWNNYQSTHDLAVRYAFLGFQQVYGNLSAWHMTEDGMCGSLDARKNPKGKNFHGRVSHIAYRPQIPGRIPPLDLSFADGVPGPRQPPWYSAQQACGSSNPQLASHTAANAASAESGGAVPDVEMGQGGDGSQGVQVTEGAAPPSQQPSQGPSQPPQPVASTTPQPEATPTSSTPRMPSTDAQDSRRSGAGHGGGGGGSALGDGLEGGAAYGELTLGQLMIDDPRDGFETDNPAYSPQAESLTELVDQLRSELEAGCPSRVLTGTFDRLRRELEAVCRHRDELLLRAAPYISEPDDCALNARGSIAGRYVTYQTDAGDFDGRIINELPGGYARILWYDRVEDYPRETYVPWLRSKDQSSRFRIKVGDESQADIPNLVPSPPEESSQLKRQRTPP